MRSALSQPQPPRMAALASAGAASGDQHEKSKDRNRNRKTGGAKQTGALQRPQAAGARGCFTSGKEPGQLHVSNTFERDIVGSVATFEEVIKAYFILGMGKKAKDAMRQSAHSLETDTKNMLQ